MAQTVPPIPPSTERYARASHIAQHYDLVFANNALFAYDCELMDAWLATPGTLLDLGCGTGRHVVHFARRGFAVTGVDLSPHMLALTRQKLAADGLNAQLIEADMLDLDALGVESFRYAVCMFSTLGMVQGHANRAQLLRKIRERVIPGGLFVFHAHNALHSAWAPWGPIWWISAKLWVRKRGLEFGDRIISMYRAIPDLFIHLFTDTEIRRLLDETGWELLELVYLNGPRNGRLKGRFVRRLRANGFVALARRPS